MDIETLARRAHEVRKQFADFEAAQYGAEWTVEDLLVGLMKDVGDLAAIIQRVEGKRLAGAKEPLDELQHELSDCLWVLLTLASRY